MERLTERSKTGTAFFDDDGVLIRGAGGAFHQKKDMTANFIHQRFVALDKTIDRLAAYEDTGLEPEEIDSVFIHSVIEENKRLKELAQAENDGRLVVLPCKIGDTVYEANKRGFISTYKVISIHISDCSVLIGWELIDGIYSNLNGFEASALGKTVFLTREEAESALKRREADNDR